MVPSHKRPGPAVWARKTLSGDGKWFALATGAASVDAAGGFWLSFTNLTAAAAAHGWHPPWMLALMIDLGVPTYVIGDHWLVAKGHRSLLARGAVWAFAAITVVLNAAVSTDPSALWRSAHMVAPAAWILGVEVVRRMWKARLRGPRPAPDRAPAAQWLAAPGRTFTLWRRKHRLGVAWPAMLALEDARVFLDALADAIGDTGRQVPAAVTRIVGSGRFPAHLAAAVTTTTAAGWEPTLIEWAGRQVALPDVVLAAVADATPEPPPVPLPNPSPPPASDPPSDTSRTPAGPKGVPAPSRRGSLPSGRDMTSEELADYARGKLGAVPVPSVNAIMALAKAEFSVGVARPKAKAAHDILESGRLTKVKG